MHMKDYVAFIFALYRRFPLFCADRSFSLPLWPLSLVFVLSPVRSAAPSPLLALPILLRLMLKLPNFFLQRLPTTPTAFFFAPHPPRPILPTLPFTSHLSILGHIYVLDTLWKASTINATHFSRCCALARSALENVQHRLIIRTHALTCVHVDAQRCDPFHIN